MSLFGSLQISANSLFAQQTGLQVTANNISNANTPGYIRQRAVFSPAPTQLVGSLPLGLGVNVEAIVQESDRFLAERLRAASSDLAGGEARQDAYLKLEAALAELSEADLSTSLTRFFGTLQDVANQPENRSVRNLAVLQGQTLAGDLKRLDKRVTALRLDINDQVVAASKDINRLVEEIADLNVNITVTEAESSGKSDAVGLRDQRDTALKNLAELVSIRTLEQDGGDVTVFVGGEYVVFEGDYRPVSVSKDHDRGLSIATVTLAATDSPLATSAGKVTGLYEARDAILGGFLDSLSELAGGLIFEFNKLHASGQGLVGFSEATSELLPPDTSAPLDQAGLPFTPTNGSFQVLVYNTETGEHTTSDIFVHLNGLESDTTLGSLVNDLNSVDGVIASINPQGRLELQSDSPILEFAFANDSSGTLAALGINTFFTGSNARDIDVNQALSDNPFKLATSQGGLGVDGENAIALGAFGSAGLERFAGGSITEQYENVVSDVTQGSAVTRAVSDGFRIFHDTLEGQLLGITGVGIDDEAIKMISYQRAYQASARMISTVSDLLEELMRL